MVAVCVGGELHEIGLRTVTDLFELEGWNTLYVGASTPTPDLVKLLAQRRPELLLVSGMIPYHFRAVANLVRAVRASKDCQRTRIFVGGYLFNMLPELWRKTGADGSAADAGEALIAVHSNPRLSGPTRVAVRTDVLAPFGERTGHRRIRGELGSGTFGPTIVTLKFDHV